jgi:anti-sigma B factor antagonist
MAVPTKVTGEGLVLSPREELVAGGPAEEFERRLQSLFQAGYRRLVTDLSGVTRIDSAGIRALVRGLTTSQRLGGSFTLVAPSPEVLTVLQLARLDSVFAIFDRVGPALAKRWPWRTVALVAGGTLLAAALAMGGPWTAQFLPDAVRQWLPGVEVAPDVRAPWQPFVEFGKLVLAALVGVTVTAVHRRYRHERPQTRSMEQAQV